MESSFVIEIKKDGSTVASLYKEVSIHSIVNERVFLETIKEVENLIYNYNKYLSNTDLCDLLLAVRILQKQDIDGSLIVNQPIMPFETINAILEEDNSFGLAYPDDIVSSEEYGIIAATKDDMKRVGRQAEVRAVVNLDDCCISFVDGWRKAYAKDWEEEFERNASELNAFNFNFDRVSFNELDEFYDFLDKNRDGFLSKKGVLSGEAITYIV